MDVRGYDDFDGAAAAVLAMLRARLGRDCRLTESQVSGERTNEAGWAVDLVCCDGSRFAAIVVAGDDEPLSAADRALVELAARLLATLVDADREAAKAVADAETDPLTGLANRRGWNRRMKIVDHHGRLDPLAGGDRVVLSVVDIEGLKEVNDRHGHAAGDELLIRAATALGAACKLGLAARIGGDEFAVWFVFEHGQAIDETASILRSTLATAGVAAAIGSARYDGTRSTEETYVEADRRMVAEKRRRRGA